MVLYHPRKYRINSHFSVERIPKDASYVEIRYSNETGKQEVQARCKYCDKFNIIDENMDI